MIPRAVRFTGSSPEHVLTGRREQIAELHDQRPAGLLFQPLSFRPRPRCNQASRYRARTTPSRWRVTWEPTSAILDATCCVVPAQSDIDFSACKRFPLTESKTIEFHADFFNVFNHANRDNPVSDITTGDFGKVLASAPARELFSLR